MFIINCHVGFEIEASPRGHRWAGAAPEPVPGWQVIREQYPVTREYVSEPMDVKSEYRFTELRLLWMMHNLYRSGWIGKCKNHGLHFHIDLGGRPELAEYLARKTKDCHEPELTGGLIDRIDAALLQVIEDEFRERPNADYLLGRKNLKFCRRRSQLAAPEVNPKAFAVNWLTTPIRTVEIRICRYPKTDPVEWLSDFTQFVGRCIKCVMEVN